MNFDENGNAQAGVHRLELQEVKTIFVDNFDDSETRERNFTGFMNFLDNPFFKQHESMFTKIWVDGSFSTNKINPNDIDAILFVNPLIDLDRAGKFIQDYYEFFKKTRLEEQYYSDIYIIMDKDILPDPDGMDEHYAFFYQQVDQSLKYWLGQFCFDRMRNPKGIFELSYVGGVFENE